MSERTIVRLVDDQELVRVGFSMILEVEDDIGVVGEATDDAEAVRQVLFPAPPGASGFLLENCPAGGRAPRLRAVHQFRPPHSRPRCRCAHRPRA